MSDRTAREDLSDYLQLEAAVRMALQRIFRHEPGPEGEPGPFAKINGKLDWIAHNMATKKDLDAAIAEVAQAARDAGTALGNLIDKVNAGEDFSTEIKELQDAHNALVDLAGKAGGATSTNAPENVNQPAPAPVAADAGGTAGVAGGTAGVAGGTNAATADTLPDTGGGGGAGGP